VLVDVTTAPLLREAITQLDWSVQLLSVGDVTLPDATSVSQLLLQDDGKLCPKNVDVNPRVDVIVILNTSGSTGDPKGVLHTHYSMVAAIHSMR
jgi:long-subunit acyl-CoA synthetase (AMP-forming)